jgi:hypothetical protein
MNDAQNRRQPIPTRSPASQNFDDKLEQSRGRFGGEFRSVMQCRAEDFCHWLRKIRGVKRCVRNVGHVTGLLVLADFSSVTGDDRLKLPGVQPDASTFATQIQLHSAHEPGDERLILA